MKIIERLKFDTCIAECGCGDISKYYTSNVQRGNTTRCKSCAIKSRGEKRRKHCCSETFKDSNPEGAATYKVWSEMKRRCLNGNNDRFSDYGGRGIKVCNSWINSFESFIEDMGFRPSSDHQIDRINNDGNYEKSNCRWATRKQNARNKRSNKIITIDGVSKCISEWAEVSGVKAPTISARIIRGWKPERAVFGNRHGRVYNTPDGEFKTLKEVQDFYNMSSSGVHQRFINKSFIGWEIN